MTHSVQKDEYWVSYCDQFNYEQVLLILLQMTVPLPDWIVMIFNNTVIQTAHKKNIMKFLYNENRHARSILTV